MLPSAFIHPMNTVLLPRFSQYSTKNDQAQTRRKAGKAIQVTSILIAVSLSIMLPLGNELAQLIYHQPSAGEHIILLSAATFFTFYHITTGSILNGIGMQKQASASIVVTGVSEILFTWLTVGRMGIGGYALACVGSELVGVAMNFYWVIRSVKSKFSGKTGFSLRFFPARRLAALPGWLFLDWNRQGGHRPRLLFSASV